MIYKDLIIDNKFNIPGRGLIFTVELRNNNLASSPWVDKEKIPFKVGDIIVEDSKVYVISGIECSANLLDGKIKSLIGLKVKVIPVEMNLTKSTQNKLNHFRDSLYGEMGQGIDKSTFDMVFDHNMIDFIKYLRVDVSSERAEEEESKYLNLEDFYGS